MGLFCSDFSDMIDLAVDDQYCGPPFRHKLAECSSREYQDTSHIARSWSLPTTVRRSPKQRMILDICKISLKCSLPLSQLSLISCVRPVITSNSRRPFTHNSIMIWGSRNEEASCKITKSERISQYWSGLVCCGKIDHDWRASYTKTVHIDRLTRIEPVHRAGNKSPKSTQLKATISNITIWKLQTDSDKRLWAMRTSTAIVGERLFSTWVLYLKGQQISGPEFESSCWKD
jgi:hypothetical protein